MAEGRYKPWPGRGHPPTYPCRNNAQSILTLTFQALQNSFTNEVHYQDTSWCTRVSCLERISDVLANCKYVSIMDRGRIWQFQQRNATRRYLFLSSRCCKISTVPIFLSKIQAMITTWPTMHFVLHVYFSHVWLHLGRRSTFTGEGAAAPEAFCLYEKGWRGLWDFDMQTVNSYSNVPHQNSQARNHEKAKHIRALNGMGEWP